MRLTLPMTFANQLLQCLVSPQTTKKVNCHPKPKTNRLPLVVQGACLCVFYKVNPNCCGDASEDPHNSTETPVDLAHTFKTAVLFYSIFLLTVTVHRNIHLKISAFFFFFFNSLLLVLTEDHHLYLSPV